MTMRENEWFIQAPWGRICLIAWGDCQDPPVLLCHGGMDSAASFRPLVQRLPKSFYYIAMEFPGNGRSDHLPPGLMISLYDLVYSVDAVARHFRWETFVLIGHSMGCYVGKLYNISCPGKLSKLIELDPINFIAIEPEHFPLWYQKSYTSYYENMEKFNASRERSSKLTMNKAIDTLKKVRGLSAKDAVATLERWTESVGEGLIRYTFDPRLRGAITTPAFSIEQIKKLITTDKTPTLSLISKESYKKGLFRNTVFLLDENIYPAKNYRCRKVDGSHDMHIQKPETVGLFVSQFLLYGLEGLDSNSKL